MTQKHATRRELAATFVDIWLKLNFNTIPGHNLTQINPLTITPDLKRAKRDDLLKIILNYRLHTAMLLHKYKSLMDDEASIINKRSIK